jgi:orotidine-5'-phosphate decarboxylase
MTQQGPGLIHQLVARGLSVFLDLKWHDIPNTVREGVVAAKRLGVQMVTVHTLGGHEMMRAAAEAGGRDLAVIGVTVLTSHSPESYGAAVGRMNPDLEAEVVRQARSAGEANLAGVVCSPRELHALRAALGPGPRLVVPGIRGTSDPPDDQTRTATAAEAAAWGATHLVVGRPVLRAKDPGRAWATLLEELG